VITNLENIFYSAPMPTKAVFCNEIVKSSRELVIAQAWW